MDRYSEIWSAVPVTLTHPCLNCDLLHAHYMLLIRNLIFLPAFWFLTGTLKLVLFFKKVYLVYVHYYKYFCNISMYLSCVMHLPEDGQMNGRNM